MSRLLALFPLILLAMRPAPPVDVLNLASGAGSAEPNLAAAPDGRVYASWIAPAAPQGDALRFSVLGPRGWAAPKTIAQGTNWFVNPADFPSMAVLSDGTLAAHWLSMRGGPGSEAYDIQIVFSKDGGASWSKPITPHRDRKERQHGFASLLPTADGKLALIWLDGRNMPNEEEGDMALMYTTVSPTGALGPELQIDSRTCECCKTALTAAPQGLLAVYRDRSADEVRDISIARFANGRWSRPEPLSKDGWRIDGCPINGPAISANGKYAAVAWFTAPGDKPQVNLLMSADSGKTFGRKIRVDGGKPAGRVEVLTPASGGAIVSWIERTAQGPRLQVRRFDANGNAAAPIDVSGQVGVSTGGFPKIALSGNRVLVAWTDASEPSHVRTAAVNF